MSVLSLNDRAMVLAEELARAADDYGVEVHTVNEARVIDAGVKVPGSIDAGLILARICLADLATVRLIPSRVGDVELPGVQVDVRFPVAACMASQYAGWQVSVGKFFAMGSGPMRAAYGKEAIYDTIGFRERVTRVVGVLETSKLPNDDVVAYVAKRCNIATRNVTLIAARTASFAGGVQVVARSVETALHKLHELKYDLSHIVAGFGTAPLPPVAENDIAAIGRTNDAVLYGGRVNLYLRSDDESIAGVGPRVPSSASRDYGEPFANVFHRYGGDFYKIDPLLFSPAMVVMHNLTTGRAQCFGQVNDDVLQRSFFG